MISEVDGVQVITLVVPAGEVSFIMISRIFSSSSSFLFFRVRRFIDDHEIPFLINQMQHTHTRTAGSKMGTRSVQTWMSYS